MAKKIRDLTLNATPDKSTTFIELDRAAAIVSEKMSLSDLESLLETLPSGVQGDIIYHNGTSWVVLNAGTSGKLLQTNGVGANPTWETAPSGLPSGVQGDILYHNGVDWVVLSAGTSGQVLNTNGAGANPSWEDAGGTIPPQLFARRIELPIDAAEDGATPPDSSTTLSGTTATVRGRKFDYIANQEVIFKFAFERYIDSSLPVTVSVEFFISEATGPSAEGVVFGASAYSISDGDDLDVTYGTEINIESGNLTLTQGSREKTGIVSITISGIGEFNSCILKLRRKADHVNDTYNQKVLVTAAYVEYTTLGT